MMPNKWFSIFFMENMISNIVQHTNEYAIHCGTIQWTKLIERKFELWLELTITMGIHRLPFVEFYIGQMSGSLLSYNSKP
jgi:hypothetical protein